MSIINEMIHVEVVYALPTEQVVFKLAVKVGVFSRNIKLDATIRDKDRIEIYRPLLADPKEIRRKRAEQAKKEAAKK